MRIEKMEGTTVAYELECQWPEDAHPAYAGRWHKRDLVPEDFGERHAKYGESWDDACPLFKNYGANGECWQKTGIDGYLDETMAIQAIIQVSKHRPGEKWRLVRRTYTVKTDVVYEATYFKESA